MSSETKNLKAISEAIDQHNRNCEFPAVAVEMNPFEVERLDWDEIKGIPIEPNHEIPTGRFEIICNGETDLDEEEVEAIASTEALTA